MIQRIQTLYLVLGALFLLALLFFDALWGGTVAEALPWFPAAVLGLAGLAALVALVAIFLYKDRRRQRQVVLLAQVLTLLLLLTLIVGVWLGDAAERLEPRAMLALALPVVAYVAFWLARRGIARDIAVVESMDKFRLR